MSDDIIWVVPFKTLVAQTRDYMHSEVLKTQIKEEIKKQGLEYVHLQWDSETYRDPDSFADILRVTATLYKRDDHERN